MWAYRCERCGCSLDPREGRYCEECLEEMQEETERRKVAHPGEPGRKRPVAAYG